MHIYQLPISLYSFKLRLALRLKDIEIPFREPPGGYRSDAFAQINPARTIPALGDGAFWLAESDAIIEYLDDAVLGRPLRSDDLQARARDRMLSRWCDFGLEPAVRRLFPLVAPETRQPSAVAECAEIVTVRLDRLEAGLDAIGPFAAGPTPGLADCGLTATCAWIDALADVGLLGRLEQPRLQRTLSAMRAHRACMAEIAAYRALTEGWVRAKIGAAP
ncbi:MAG: glutathione S-transferase family protein [Methylobacteriaceae bacterium]|nr:glutathione S-transferase family protein [Methylobacteriaceae bacterium]